MGKYRIIQVKLGTNKWLLQQEYESKHWITLEEYPSKEKALENLSRYKLKESDIEYIR